jgi:hypothetical protein
MNTKAQFYELIERLADHDRTVAESELKTFRAKLGEQVDKSRRRLRIASLAVLLGIPATLVGQALALGASHQPPTMPDWLGYVGLFLAFGGMVLVPLGFLWILFYFLPRYVSARSDLRDSMLALLICRIDELSQRIDQLENEAGSLAHQ